MYSDSYATVAEAEKFSRGLERSSVSTRALTSFSEAAQGAFWVAAAAHCALAAQGAFWAAGAAGAASAAKSAEAEANIAAIDIISLFSIVFSFSLSFE